MLKDHIPYLERPFPTQVKFGAWIVNQVPPKHRNAAQKRFDDMSTANRSNPHKVTSEVVDIMAKARTTLETLKEGSASDFVGIMDDTPTVSSSAPLKRVVALGA